MSEFLKTFDKLNDAQLRSSVKLLGKLLGNIIKSHAGDDVYIAVEKLRKGLLTLEKAIILSNMINLFGTSKDWILQH